jgi:hypothetical protein
MQYVIDPIEVFGLFDGADIRRFFDHANHPLVARSAAAVNAGLDIRNVIADGAQTQLGLHVAHRRRQRLRILIIRTQDVKPEPLRCLAANSRQLLQFINQPRHRLRKFRHRNDCAIV